MKILGIDTSSKVLGIAVCEDRKILAEYSQIVERQHSDLLVPKIKEMLEKINLRLDEVQAFVVGLGPGSFTGLRIGVSTVKGFGMATKKICIGIPSIDALALNVDEQDKRIVPVIDAKRENVYSAIYKKNKNGITRESAHLLLGIDRLMKKVKGKAIFLGDGLSLYKDKIKHFNKKAIFLEEDCWYPKASNLIKLALKNMKKNKKMDLAKLKPIYLYSKYCQIK